jgi:AraC family transcriptional regulator
MNLSKNLEIITRLTTHYVFLEKRGPFAKVAPPAWEQMIPLMTTQVDQKRITGVLGLSRIDPRKTGDDAMIYQAGVTVSEPPSATLNGLQYKKIDGGKYARFLLIGPYQQIGPAFDQIFKTLADKKVELREEFCIEAYLNDPKVTPEDKLETEILIPAA